MNWLDKMKGEALIGNKQMEPMKRIAKKIKWLKKVDVNFEVYGAELHEYKMHKSIKASKIHAFESEHQVQLPQSYKDFLSTIGNGGLGPNTGILSLEKSHKLYLDSGAWTVSIEGAGYAIVLGEEATAAEQGPKSFNERVCLDGRAAGDALKPLYKQGNPKTFLDWFEEWLHHNMEYFMYRDDH